MRRLVQQAVGTRQIFKLEARAQRAGLIRPAFVGLGRPDDAVRTQRVGHAHHVEQVPAPAIVLPFAAIRVHQVAPEHEARDLVVKADSVVAHANCSGLSQQTLDAGRKFIFRQPALQAQLRRNAGNQAGHRIGQVIIGRLAVNHHRLTDLVEVGIGANAGKLARPITPRIQAKGFVVMPEKGVRGH